MSDDDHRRRVVEPNEARQGNRETHGNLNSRIRETSITWKTLSPTRTTGQVRETDLHLEEGEGEEDPRNSQITTEEIHISTASIMEEAIAHKGV
jgi:hypothetical protein